MTRTETDPDTYVRDSLGGAIDGQSLVAAVWCRPGGSTEKGHEGFARKLKRLVGGPDDGLRDSMILAATDTRLILYVAKAGFGGLRAGRQVGEWPVPAQLGSRDRTAVHKSWDNIRDRYESSRHALTSLTLPDGRVVETPRGKEIKRLVRWVNARQ